MKIVGRIQETKKMQRLLTDNQAHLLAMVGRRRVGKTFLIREVYKSNKTFEMTGLKDGDLEKQLLNFSFQMNQYFPSFEINQPDNWLTAFNQLSRAITLSSGINKPVVFFDEVPWIASKKSGFTEALAHWWNNWASQKNIIVVLCGSAASWMLEHVVNAKGGLHNRITQLITLMPFTLKETNEFLNSRGIELSHYQLIQLYLAVGGIPHYLNHIIKGKSAAQSIQELCFDKDGILKNEFENLYAALFENAHNHINIIRALASKSTGLDRQELLKLTNKSDGGWFSKILQELETSGFISSYEPLEKKKKDTLYRLTDEYSLFYLTFIEKNKKAAAGNWMRISQSQAYKIWCGYTFENCCIKHIHEIKNALGISGVETAENSFLHKANKEYEKGFQIDILIDRKDDIINICEMKFYADEYTINSDYAKKLRTKKEGLRTVTKTKKMIHTTFITSYGLVENKHKIDLVDNDFTIGIFF
ncbi:AAA family ATPase [Crocinitomix algicola]|uniref:AAA family ATPase n=1 Tax=Crocinitomix algicola TaxID=1740263 RepID=UPI000872CF8A|nr:ATP-binding protein [Crocinitomix algicola]